MRNLCLSVVLILIASLLLATLALAAGKSSQRSLVGSGGGQVRAEGLTLRGAIGQPVVGVVRNGISLCSGYHCAPSAPAGNNETWELYLPLVTRNSK